MLIVEMESKFIWVSIIIGENVGIYELMIINILFGVFVVVMDF